MTGEAQASNNNSIWMRPRRVRALIAASVCDAGINNSLSLTLNPHLYALAPILTIATNEPK